MAIYKRKDRDSWVARLTGPDGKITSRNFPRKSDASRWYAEQLAKRENGNWIRASDAKVTLAEFYEQWAQRQVWSRSTELAMSLSVRSCAFRDAPLGKIRRSHVEAWVKAQSQTLAPRTVKSRVTNVRNVLRAAVRDRMIASDPSDGVVLPRQRRRDIAMEIPTDAQLRALLEAASKDFRPFLMLCTFAGLRSGEAAGVQVGDIDFLRRTIKIRRQVQRAEGGGVEIRPPKFGSERDIYVPDALLAELSNHIAGKGLAGKEAWLFVTRSGAPPHQNVTGVEYRQTCKRACVKGFTLHSLRHFFASAAISAGADVVTVQHAMGHSSAATTLSTYAHLFPSAEDRTRQASAQSMARVLDVKPHPQSTQEDRPGF